MHTRIAATIGIGLLRVLIAVAFSALPHSTFAQCESFDSETTALGLTPTVITTVSQNFSVCYDPDLGAALFRRLLSRSFIRVYVRGHSIFSAF